MSDEILTRKEAIQRGLTRYFTGKPCPNGHVADRYAITAACTKCVLTYQKRSKQNMYNNARMQASGFEMKKILIHPIDFPVIKEFAKFVNESRMDKRRNGDIQTVRDYIRAIELAWSFTSD